MDKGKATDAADMMVVVVLADKAVDWATQVSLKGFVICHRSENIY